MSIETLGVVSKPPNKVVTIGLCGTYDPRLQVGDAERARNLVMMTARKIDGRVKMPDGSSVRIVCATVLVDGVMTADIVASQFKAAGVDAIGFVCDTWAFPGATVEALLNHFPKNMDFFFVCGNSGPKPGVVFTHSSNGMESQFGKMSQMIIGSWPDEGQDVEMTDETALQLVDFCQALVGKLGPRGERLVVWGHGSMWMRTGEPHVLATLDKFNVQILAYDMKLLVDLFRGGKYDKEELKTLLGWIDESFGDRRQSRGDASADACFQDGLAYYLIMRDFLRQNNAVGGAFMQQLEWASMPECIPLPILDTAESLFNSTVDHNGPKAPTPFGTETDMQATLTMLFNHYLSAGEPGLFMDFRKVWEGWEIRELCKLLDYTLLEGDRSWVEGFFDGDNSGSGSWDWAGTPEEEMAVKLQRIRTFLADPGYFHGKGDSIQFFTPAGIRHIVDRLAYHYPSNTWSLLWDEAETVMPPEKIAMAVAKKSTFGWPHTFIRLLHATMLQAKNYAAANHIHGIWRLRSRVMRYWLHLMQVKDVHASKWPKIDDETPPVPLVTLMAPDGWKHQV